MRASRISIGMAFICLVAFTYTGHIRAVEKDQLKQVAKLSTTLDMAYAVKMSFQTVESGERGFIISNNTEYLLQYYDGKQQVRRQLILLCDLTSDHEGQCKDLNVLIENKLAIMDSTIKQCRYGGRSEVISGFDGNKDIAQMRSIRELIDDISGYTMQQRNNLLVARISVDRVLR